MYALIEFVGGGWRQRRRRQRRWRRSRWRRNGMSNCNCVRMAKPNGMIGVEETHIKRAHVATESESRIVRMPETWFLHVETYKGAALRRNHCCQYINSIILFKFQLTKSFFSPFHFILRHINRNWVAPLSVYSDLWSLVSIRFASTSRFEKYRSVAIDCRRNQTWE